MKTPLLVLLWLSVTSPAEDIVANPETGPCRATDATGPLAYGESRDESGGRTAAGWWLLLGVLGLLWLGSTWRRDE